MPIDRLNQGASASPEDLIAVICLADELLMKARGAFPLPGDPDRENYLIVRSFSGDDYHERKILAASAIAKATGK